MRVLRVCGPILLLILIAARLRVHLAKAAGADFIFYREKSACWRGTVLSAPAATRRMGEYLLVIALGRGSVAGV